MKSLIISTLSAFLFLSLAGCNQSGFGIFYSIKSEEPLVNRELDDSLTVSEISKANNDYYLAAGPVYFLDTGVTDAQWEQLSPPEPGQLCSSLASNGSYVYAVYYSSDGSTSTLYQMQPSVSHDWTAADPTTLSGKRVESVVEAAGSFFVSVKEGTNLYDLYTDIAASNDFVIDANAEVIDMSRRIVDAAYDGADIWITNGSTILYGTADTWASDNEPVATANCTGLFFSTLYGDLYAAFSSGEVFINSAGTWGATADTEDLGSLSDFAEINRNANDILILGSENGYYETSTGTTFAEPDPDNELTTNQNYLNIELKDAIITTIFVDGDAIFAGTVGKGLWKNTDSAWARE